MPRPSLSGARKTTAKAVADKIAGKKTTKSTKSTKSTTAVADKIPTTSITAPSGNVTGFSTVVPGLIGITPDAVAGMMPKFEEKSYAISDPLNFPETLPQVTESQHDRNQALGNGAIRAL